MTRSTALAINQLFKEHELPQIPIGSLDWEKIFISNLFELSKRLKEKS